MGDGVGFGDSEPDASTPACYQDCEWSWESGEGGVGGTGGGMVEGECEVSWLGHGDVTVEARLAWMLVLVANLGWA